MSSSKNRKRQVKEAEEAKILDEDEKGIPKDLNPQEIIQLVNDSKLPNKDKQEIITRLSGFVIQASVTRESYSMQGMLPPSKLKEFDDVLENGAERVFGEVTGQTRHRQYLEKSTVDSNNKQSERGQIMAFILFALVIIGSFVFIALGKDVAGIAGIIGACGAGLGIFFIGRKTQ